MMITQYSYYHWRADLVGKGTATRVWKQHMLLRWQDPVPGLVTYTQTLVRLTGGYRGSTFMRSQGMSQEQNCVLTGWWRPRLSHVATALWSLIWGPFSC